MPKIHLFCSVRLGWCVLSFYNKSHEKTPLRNVLTMSFNPNTFSEFRFISATFDDVTRTAKLLYALDDKFTFSETYTFPEPFNPTWKIDHEALQIALNLLHLAAGVSYFKSALPPQIVLENQTLSQESAAFFNTLYLNGLGEFAYRNSISLKDRISFPFSNKVTDPRTDLQLPALTAVPLGGGKDSLVTLEALLAASEKITPIAIGDYLPINAVAKCRNLDLPLIHRQIDPLLIELNKAGAYNGHVPISAIIVFTLTAAAIICGYNTIAISQERSANEPNLQINGVDINHQYSKSFDFELSLQTLLKRQIPNLNYFSFLRPLSELGICKLFAEKCQVYFNSFSSCNRSFSSTNPLNGTRWCCNCPKCRFIFLALAPFLDKERIISIFGKNLLNDAAQETGYRELLGLTGNKPFECVGEIKESRAAFSLLAAQRAWQNDALIRIFSTEYADQLSQWHAATESILTPSTIHAMPPHFKDILDAF